MKWVSAFSYLPVNYSVRLAEAADQTQRITFDNNLNGKTLRLCLSNRWSKSPLTLAKVTVGKAAGDGVRGVLPVTRDGSSRITLAPGEECWSDPVALPVQAGDRLAIQTYLDQTQSVESICAFWASTGPMVELSAAGDFSIHFKNRYGTQDGQEKLLRPYSFSLQPAVVQQIYGGGSVRNGYRQALVGYDMATLEQQLTELDVTYLAEYNYWNLASNAALLEASVRYEQIVRTMYDVIRTRFEDGYVAKNDLLMIQTRLRSAEFYRIQVENLYRVALQNFNVLSGVEPDMPRRIADSITEPSPLPQPVDLERALGEHPDYLIASRRIEYERYGVKLASARFMPRLSAGVQGVWNSLSPISFKIARRRPTLRA